MDNVNHSVSLLGTEVLVRSIEEGDALLARVAQLEALAEQARQLPNLLARLDVSERRFSQIRRMLTRATDAVSEAANTARTDLYLEVTPAPRDAKQASNA